MAHQKVGYVVIKCVVTVQSTGDVSIDCLLRHPIIATLQELQLKPIEVTDLEHTITMLF